MLKGKFFFRIGPENYFHTGIIRDVADGYALVYFDKSDRDPASWVFPMELIPLYELAKVDYEGMRLWNFFKSRKDLEDYLAWLDDGPSRSAKLLNLVK